LRQTVMNQPCAVGAAAPSGVKRQGPTV
jgi:hypothetical protein